LFQFFSAVCSQATLQSWSSCQTLSNDVHFNFFCAASINISILIVIQKVIQWSTFQPLYAVCSQVTFQSWSSFKKLFNDACINSSMKSALKQYFNLDRHANDYTMMLVSIPLCSLLSNNISILRVISNVTEWCFFNSFVRSALKQYFNLDHVIQVVIQGCLFQFLYAVCSQPTFQSWSSFKSLFNDSYFNFSVQSIHKQHYNLDRHSNRYPMMIVSIPLCSLFSSNISILIDMPNVIQWCSFQFLYTASSQKPFQSWSTCKTLSNDYHFNYYV
jgi:hypothetical protein